MSFVFVINFINVFGVFVFLEINGVVFIFLLLINLCYFCVMVEEYVLLFFIKRMMIFRY